MPELTAREEHILYLIQQGLSNDRLAYEFTLSPAQIETIIKCIKEKTGAKNYQDLMETPTGYRSV